MSRTQPFVHVLLTMALLLAVPSATLLAQQSSAKPANPGVEKDLIAVMDLDAVGAEKAQAAALSERLREELLKTGQFILVDRSQMDKLLEEQALQQTGCTSSDCAVRVGRILGVRKLVMGKLTRVEDTLWQVSVVLVDVETAQTLKAETLDHDGTYRNLLLSGLGPLASRLAGSRAPVADGRPPGPAVKVALFPVRLSGAPPQAERAAAMGIANIATSGRSNLTVSYSPYPDLFPGGKGLDASLASDAWTSISAKPDAALVAAKAKQLGVDAVFMIYVARIEKSSGGRLTVYRIDAATRAVAEQSKEWKAGFVTLAVAEATRDMLISLRNGRSG